MNLLVISYDPNNSYKDNIAPVELNTDRKGSNTIITASIEKEWKYVNKRNIFKNTIVSKTTNNYDNYYNKLED